ncbi:SPFH domain-containing protein [Tenacibaculum aiptasiae]|uniref:SPFH domain-containing protein n=1 Tax=Tenacibaculum aiptasiae TaxID=426481 RepID=A0A7J5ARU9_9FLAO|nr:SPFH domain-containing protein [Tenacibaculum aiptasiae]KAB1160365.1 SPFH domain-containing protein [Tenacibaculum aiptasiae]
MGIFDEIKKKLSHEFIDIIEWLDNTNDTIVHRFERYQNEIKNGAQLVVREGQIAVFINEGQLADVFKPGTYTLNTQNLPILATLKGWKYGFNSPFKAEVYFVSSRMFTDEKWGTKNPITLNDDRFGFVEIRAFGTYAFKINDAGKFITDIVGTDSHFTNYEINEHLKSLISTRFTDTIGEANLPIELYAANTNELSETCLEVMNPEFNSVGISLEKFFIENVSMPEELKKEIFEYSRLNKVDLDKLAKFKAAKAMEAAASNESGAAGAGMGMGMGFAMAQQMGNLFNQQTQSKTVNQPASTGATPPPLPNQVQYYYAANGQQAGPVNFEALKNLFAARSINAETLVWKQGMANWTSLQSVPELQNLLGSVPPPLPNN